LNGYMKGGAIIDIGGIHILIYHQADVVEHKNTVYLPQSNGGSTAFLANFLFTVSFTAWMNKLDAVSIHDPDQAGVWP